MKMTERGVSLERDDARILYDLALEMDEPVAAETIAAKINAHDNRARATAAKRGQNLSGDTADTRILLGVFAETLDERGVEFDLPDIPPLARLMLLDAKRMHDISAEHPDDDEGIEAAAEARTNALSLVRILPPEMRRQIIFGDEDINKLTEELGED